jgi:hypothetical protein
VGAGELPTTIRNASVSAGLDWNNQSDTPAMENDDNHLNAVRVALKQLLQPVFNLESSSVVHKYVFQGMLRALCTDLYGNQKAVLPSFEANMKTLFGVSYAANINNVPRVDISAKYRSMSDAGVINSDGYGQLRDIVVGPSAQQVCAIAPSIYVRDYANSFPLIMLYAASNAAFSQTYGGSQLSWLNSYGAMGVEKEKLQKAFERQVTADREQVNFIWSEIMTTEMFGDDDSNGALYSAWKKLKDLRLALTNNTESVLDSVKKLAECTGLPPVMVGLTHLACKAVWGRKCTFTTDFARAFGKTGLYALGDTCTRTVKDGSQKTVNIADVRLGYNFGNGVTAPQELLQGGYDMDPTGLRM